VNFSGSLDTLQHFGDLDMLFVMLQDISNDNCKVKRK
jgi:hypothetical protein